MARRKRMLVFVAMLCFGAAFIRPAFAEQDSSLVQLRFHFSEGSTLEYRYTRLVQQTSVEKKHFDPPFSDWAIRIRVNTVKVLQNGAARVNITLLPESLTVGSRKYVMGRDVFNSENKEAADIWKQFNRLNGTILYVTVSPQGKVLDFEAETNDVGFVGPRIPFSCGSLLADMLFPILGDEPFGPDSAPFVFPFVTDYPETPVAINASWKMAFSRSEYGPFEWVLKDVWEHKCQIESIPMSGISRTEYGLSPNQLSNIEEMETMGWAFAEIDLETGWISHYQSTIHLLGTITSNANSIFKKKQPLELIIVDRFELIKDPQP